MSSPDPPEILASSTLHLLTTRLHRLTYLLTGDTTWTGTPTPPEKPSSHEETVSRRLAELERELGDLSSRFAVVREVLAVYDRFPELFTSTSTPITTTSPNPEDNQQPPSTPIVSDLDQKTTTSLILSHATTYPETASRLTSLSDTPIPPAETSTSLISLQPRMDKLAGVQAQQMGEISELRVRSARVVKRWYEVVVLGGGEVWGEWEGRVEGVERGVRRGEVAVQREG
ncbi:hypothetical protein BDW59DRAFT_165486 [Aspergillus cavernicola]|uniref:Nuclear distribution protein RO10 n=1 Tax=Aspergillus cavernicola TaxID=176166 RepID=A0ABR4HTG0_9EURO